MADPRAKVVVGVTPKSYGFFHQNKREQEGRALLEAASGSRPPLPGTNINDGWLGAVEAVEAAYGPRFGLRVSRRRYRTLQASNVYTRRHRGEATAEEMARLEANLPPLERLLYRSADGLARMLVRVMPGRLWSPRAIRFAPEAVPEAAARSGRAAYANMIDDFEGAE